MRDRIQHVEKMDLPSIKVMIERAIAKAGYRDEQILELLANVIIILDETARANAIKGVAGMRSYFFWVDSVANGIDIIESLYQKVIYKITTDSDEIKILEESLSKQGIRSELSEISNQVKYGSQFNADSIAKKRPPDESPSLVVALRIDESASMSAFGRLEAAKRAAVAVYEFCEQCKIPIIIYGDTADRSSLEQMSLYAYCDFTHKEQDDRFRLMNIQGRSNNRDGQPKAMPDYSGDVAISDMQMVLKEYRRKGIIFLAAAIGQDKETLCDIYGKESFLDITDLRQLPVRLVKIIARYLSR